MGYELFTDTIENWSQHYHGPKFHAVLCDPPYGLEFMGKEWDKFDSKPRKVAGTGGTQAPFAHHSVKLTPKRNGAFQAKVTEWGEALLPHLYPGAFVLMFGGTRTWHRLATGMEDAGFEMWDTLMWLYGTGFPKGQDISKMIDKKNGDTREIVGRKTFADGSFGRATGGDFDGTPSDSVDRTQVTAPGSSISAPWAGHKTPALKPAWEPILAFRVPSKQTYAELALEHGSGALNIEGARIATMETIASHMMAAGGHGHTTGTFATTYKAGDNGKFTQTAGRYPANLLLDDESAAQLDAQSGVSKSTGGQASLGAFRNGDIYGAGRDETEKRNPGLGDKGGASRFFYCAKASTSERNAGLEGKNTHPTVKPLSVVEYLAKLLLPPDSVSPRRVLVPFSGSGSEMIGALKAGWDEVVGVEMEAEYCEIASARLAHHVG